MGKIYEERRVNQADTALRLYDYFLSQTSLPKTRDPSPDKESWRSLEEKMREALRLRQRSLSTEKTYLLWLRNFGNFVNGKSPHQLEGRDLQAFLRQLGADVGSGL